MRTGLNSGTTTPKSDTEEEDEFGFSDAEEEEEFGFSDGEEEEEEEFGFGDKNTSSVKITTDQASDTLCIAADSLDVQKIKQETKADNKVIRVTYQLVANPDCPNRKTLVATYHGDGTAGEKGDTIRDAELKAILKDIKYLKGENVEGEITDYVLMGDLNTNALQENKDGKFTSSEAATSLLSTISKELPVDDVAISQAVRKKRLFDNIYSNQQVLKGGVEAVSSSMWVITGELRVLADSEKTSDFITNNVKKFTDLFKYDKALSFEKDDIGGKDHAVTNPLEVNGVSFCADGALPTKGKKAITKLDTLYNLEKLPGADAKAKYGNLLQLQEASTNKLLSLFAKKTTPWLSLKKPNRAYQNTKSAAYSNEDTKSLSEFIKRVDNNEAGLTVEEMKKIVQKWIKSDEFGNAQEYTTLKEGVDPLDVDIYFKGVADDDDLNKKVLTKFATGLDVQAGGGFSAIIGGEFDLGSRGVEQKQVAATASLFGTVKGPAFYACTESGEQSKNDEFFANLDEIFANIVLQNKDQSQTAELLPGDSNGKVQKQGALTEEKALASLRSPSATTLVSPFKENDNSM
jgi:hypothetical protein